mmetsp:Transcript_99557/g.280911  ORF Transcript_99557/g.280911 Transcript_99557/m.280911 type:complete len:239 (+) Transcript_99557:167-883(+)
MASAGFPLNDMDWVKSDGIQAEFADRDRKRQLRHLARFRRLTAEGLTPAQRPWAALGATKASALASDAPTPAPATPIPSRGVGATPGPPRRAASAARVASPACPASWLGSPPQTGASASSRPPRTSSTTMSCLWRRALSTPGRTSDSRGGHAPLSAEDEQEWQAATDHLAPEEFARLVEHVHSRVLRERRRRRQAETDLTKLRAGEAGDVDDRRSARHLGSSGGALITAPYPKTPGAP